MATLLIESLSHNKTSFQIAVRAIEILLLSAGLVSTFIMFKGAVSPYSYDLMLSNLWKPFSYFRSWLSSSFYICIILNLVVVLIGVSSIYHHPKMDKNGDIQEDGDGFEDYDMHGALSPSLSPPPAPPPMQNNHKNHTQEPKPKEIFVVAATAAVTASKKGRGKIKSSTASLKNQQDTRETNDFDKFDASFQEGLSDIPGLTKAKAIRKAPTAKSAGGKTKTATASLKNQQDRSMDTTGVEKVDDESFEANFSDFSKLTEVKEIKKPHSVDSSPQFITIQKTTKTSTTKDEQRTLNGVENQFGQTQKQLENEEGEEEDEDTMEATWRSIKEGGTKPQKKQLKKSETWQQPQTVVAAQDNNNESEEFMPSSAAAWKELRKSMTFNDTVSIRCKGGLRRDPSMTLEEFNQRVEAFIKKFNNEMRLQRQESEQRYLDMISRGL